MKKITSIILTALLCGCLFISTGIPVSAMPGYKPADNAPMYGGLSFNYRIQPNLLNTFNNLFPIYSYEKEVCRKPFSGTFFLKNQPVFPMTSPYSFQEFTYKTLHLGSHFLKIEGNSIYKNGNTMLLIPQSYITPTHPSFPLEMPQVVIPSSN